MMMAAWNKHAGIIITLLAFLAPMACHGGVALLCDGGWVSPIQEGLNMVCPKGSTVTPLPLPSPIPNVLPAPPPSGAGLHLDYYNSSHSNFSCPNAEAIVRKVVEAEIASQGPGIAAGLIRLFFHDCFVLGCDASVLLNTTASGNNDTELQAPPNKDSLRGMDVIDKAKYELEKEGVCPNTVSCADIVAFAARDAARNVSGGKIDYKAEGGRWDGRESSAGDTGTLPGPFSDIATLKKSFKAQGLNETDLGALSGAHSIGRARCEFISGSPGMNQTLVAECQGNPNKRLDQDNKTPDVLDTKYYQNVDDDNALFDSDYALANSTDTKELVEKYKANSGNVWEKAYEESVTKMGRINVKTKGDKGVEIRAKCWTVNK